MKKFGMIVGNGFSIDLTTLLKSSFNCDTSAPLREFSSVHISYEKFINDFPAIKKELYNKTNDFNAINNFLINNYRDPNKLCQLRRFLALSYAYLQKHLEKNELIFRNWKWTNWIKSNKSLFEFAISFNYDRNLEKSLDIATIPYHRIGTNEPKRNLPLLKPHGSMDFDLPNSAIKADNILDVTTELNDFNGHVQVLPRSKWLNHRHEADLVPPSSFNIQTRLSWIQEMFKKYKYLSKRIEHLIIVGLSYWGVDRPEIDYFLNHLNKNTTVYIMNPYPSSDLINKLNQLNLRYVVLGFDDLPW